MIRFVIRRMLLSIPVLFGIVFLVFALARLIPGDPCAAALRREGDARDLRGVRAALRAGQAHPDPVPDLPGRDPPGRPGHSVQFGRHVTTVLVRAVAADHRADDLRDGVRDGRRHHAGHVSAVRRNSPVDVGHDDPRQHRRLDPRSSSWACSSRTSSRCAQGHALRAAAVGPAEPGRARRAHGRGVGTRGSPGPPRAILDFVSGMYIGGRPGHRQVGGLGDALRHMILPAIALGTIPMAIIARMTRSSLLDVLGLDYIRTARAKGLRERLVVSRHAMRNALLPVVTVVGLSLGGLLSGAVLTETIFNLSGIGRTVIEAITARDYVIIQGMTIVIASIYIVVNLLVDVRYAFLDPRIRLTMMSTSTPARPGPERRIRGRADAHGGPATCGATPPATSCASDPRRRADDHRAPGVRGGLRRRRRDPRPEPVDARRTRDRRQGAGRPVHPPPRLSGEPTGALLRSRRQRPRRVHPGRLRRRVWLLVGVVTVGVAILVGDVDRRGRRVRRRAVDNIIMRLMDVLLLSPPAPGDRHRDRPRAGLTNAMIAMGIVAVPIYARVMRASVLATRETRLRDGVQGPGRVARRAS